VKIDLISSICYQSTSYLLIFLNPKTRNSTWSVRNPCTPNHNPQTARVL